jgi:hypothetical protein
LVERIVERIVERMAGGGGFADGGFAGERTAWRAGVGSATAQLRRRIDTSSGTSAVIRAARHARRDSVTM